MVDLFNFSKNELNLLDNFKIFIIKTLKKYINLELLNFVIILAFKYQKFLL